MATSLLETLHLHFPTAHLDILIRKGNEGLFVGHPYLNDVLIWEKKDKKYLSLFKNIFKVRKKKYDYVINLQRFGATGLLTALSNAKTKIGFDKNPFSFFYHKKYTHHIGNGTHEIERNHQLITDLVDGKPSNPRLYPTSSDFEKIKHFSSSSFICLAPASVWFTKQLPQSKWINLIKKSINEEKIYLLGGPNDFDYCEKIKEESFQDNVENLASQLNLLQSAALMSAAKMNYVNDSAPLHLASAMNAPVTAFFCSTIPEFGFTPLSDKSIIIQIKTPLICRPCGLHGKKKCPEGHFKCGNDIDVNDCN